MSEELDELAKRRLKGDMASFEATGAAAAKILGQMPGADAFHAELNRRGLPRDTPAGWIIWPAATFHYSASALLEIGLDLKASHQAIHLVADELFDNTDEDLFYKTLDVDCDCKSPMCPRAPIRIDQIRHALISGLVAIEQILIPFDCPELSPEGVSEEDVQAYKVMVDKLVEQHKQVTKKKMISIAELMMEVGLKMSPLAHGLTPAT